VNVLYSILCCSGAVVELAAILSISICSWRLISSFVGNWWLLLHLLLPLVVSLKAKTDVPHARLGLLSRATRAASDVVLLLRGMFVCMSSRSPRRSIFDCGYGVIV
jgi:hypothetical protein